MTSPTRRTVLASISAAAVLITRPGAVPHSDAALLAVCDQLRVHEATERRLRAATSDAEELETAEDYAWDAYQRTVWPGFSALENTLPALLLELRATTAESLAAKAAAILAMDNLPGLNLRDDSYELNRSVIEDAAALSRASA